jgi:hypothetical protein
MLANRAEAGRLQQCACGAKSTPLSNSNTTMPKAHRSIALPYDGSPNSISGARYEIVTQLGVMSFFDSSRHQPQSAMAILKQGDGQPINKFWGLMSR